MPTPFLKQVVDHYASEGAFSDLCFVFPNRRSVVFFKKYLSEAVKASGKPVMAPDTLTVNDFFFKISGKRPADRVSLLLELYDRYKTLNKDAEPLDEFIFWGDVILGDFDDVDKYLVDARLLFANVVDFKSLQDTFSYLTDTQRRAVENFVRHFREGDRLTVNPDAGAPNVKERFLLIWQLLHPLYMDFRRALSEKGMAYEGMAYRELAERMRDEPAVDVLRAAFPRAGRFVFVGHNALTECEKAVMRKMRDAGVADFCWDYSSGMIKDILNKSSFFMSRNVEDFRPAFKIDPDGLGVPEVEVVSVPSSVGQVKLVPGLLEEAGEPYEDCSIVIPDETLLMPLLNSIPPRVSDVNVTMGYPMGSSAFFDFFSAVNALQLRLREKDGLWYFHHSQVATVLASSVFKRIAAASPLIAEKASAVRREAKFFIPEADFAGEPFLELVFKPVVKDLKATDGGQIKAFVEYQEALIEGLASKIVEDGAMAMELDFAKAALNAVRQLGGKNLAVKPLTYVKLLGQLLAPVSVPFKGEPLKGLQVMGPLETRALDFKRLVVLSCNEGVFPKASVSSSFVPPELRKGFGLPTNEFQDAVWAYYFYRMIQRAEKVTLVYDSRTEGLNVGEESRYVKQLQYHFGLPLKRSFVKADAKARNDVRSLPKTAEDVAKLREVVFSASSLKDYLDCPAKFYYSKIIGLRKEDEVSESLDSGMMGTVYHATMQALYMGEAAMDPSYNVEDKALNARFPNPLRRVTKEYVESWLKREKEIKARVDSLVRNQLRTFEVSGRDLVTENVILQYVKKTLRREVELMGRLGVDSFEVLGLEKKLSMDFEGFKFVGYIDRMDSFLPGEVRVVDYKTGKVEDKDVDINPANAEAIAEELFAEDSPKRPKIAFQIFLYDYLAEVCGLTAGKSVTNSIYQPSALFTREIKNVPMCVQFNEAVKARLKDTLTEACDTGVDWRRTADTKVCEWCDFKGICGR